MSVEPDRDRVDAGRNSLQVCRRRHDLLGIVRIGRAVYGDRIKYTVSSTSNGRKIPVYAFVKAEKPVADRVETTQGAGRKAVSYVGEKAFRIVGRRIGAIGTGGSRAAYHVVA